MPEISQAEWLTLGIRAGFCSELICQTHDMGPMWPEEMDEWEQGGDPCCFVVRLWDDRGPPPGAERAGEAVAHGGSTQPAAEQSQKAGPRI